MHRRTQRGAVLIVTLMLLIAVTLIALASIDSSTMGFLVVGNVQSQKDAEAAAQEGIEVALSSSQQFRPDFVGPVPVDISAGRTVDLLQVECREWLLADGYSATVENAPIDTRWWMTATHTNAEGASATIHQGVAMRMPAASCIAP
jgi:FlaG/FlaF family flagellin (archaellin)